MNKNINETISYKTIELTIKNLKYPLVFIVYLFKTHKLIIDKDLSLLMRYFLKNQLDLVVENDIRNLLILLPEDYKNTRKIVNDFYLTLIKKIQILIELKKFKNNYSNIIFWRKSIINQIYYLNEKQNYLKSIFDNSFNINPFYAKLNSFTNNKIIIKEMKNRLKYIFKIFRLKFLLNYDVLIISEEEFDNLEFEGKKKYLTYIHSKIKKILNNLSDLFYLYKSTHNSLLNIITPEPIELSIDNVFSDTDFDDILFLIEN